MYLETLQYGASMNGPSQDRWNKKSLVSELLLSGKDLFFLILLLTFRKETTDAMLFEQLFI